MRFTKFKHIEILINKFRETSSHNQSIQWVKDPHCLIKNREGFARANICNQSKLLQDK